MGQRAPRTNERPDRRRRAPRGPAQGQAPPAPVDEQESLGAQAVPEARRRERSSVIHFGRGDQAFIEGAKGLGKTRLMMAFVQALSSVVVFDPTNRPDEWPAFGLQHGFKVTRDPEDIRRFPKVVMLVDQLWLEDRAGWKKPGQAGWNWTKCLTYAYQRGNTMVVFEEAIQTLPSIGPHPGARRMLTQGRGNDTRTMVALQGMIGVDTYSARLAEHFICFMTKHGGDLQAIYDNRRVDPRPLTELAHLQQDGGRRVFVPGAGGSRKQFAYHRLGSSEWLLCDPLQEFFAGPKRTTSATPRDLAEVDETG